MEIFSKVETFRSEKCVICERAEPMTEEHVFAESAGGVLIAYILCRGCNTKLGHNIDEPYLQDDFVKVARNALKIGGRRGNVPQPFAGPHTVPGPSGDARVTLDDDLNTKALPYAKINVLEDGRVSSEFRVDATERDTLPAIIRSKFERFFKSKEGLAFNASVDEQERIISSVITANMASQVQETPVEPIKITLAGDYGVLLLQAAKVAYEIACIEDGETYIKSELGIAFRSLLMSADRGRIAAFKTYEDMCRAFHVIPLTDEFPLRESLNELTKGRLRDYHIAIRTGCDVVVSMFGVITLFAGAFTFTSKRAVYMNDCVDGSVCVMHI